MKKLITILSIIGIVFVLLVQTVNAQHNVRWESRAGIDIATQDMGNADLNTGFGFDGLLSYRFMEYTSVFGGWGWHRFTSDGSFAGSNMDFEETGYTFGLEFQHPLSNTPMDFYIRSGGIYNHIEVENNNGDITADSGHGFGWQAEAGIVFNLSSDKWVIKPGVRYRSLSRDIEIGNTTTGIDLTYFNFGVGISSSL